MDMQPDDLVEAAGNATGGFAAGMPSVPRLASPVPRPLWPLAMAGAGFPGAGASSSFPGSGASSGFPARGPLRLGRTRSGSPGMSGLEGEASGINPASNSAAMADPDLAIVAVVVGS